MKVYTGCSLISFGDRVLIQQVAFPGPHKAASRWLLNNQIQKSNASLQCLAGSYRKVPVKTLHRNVFD